jgi:two-component system chemotaxis sensor kinase CheA
MQTLMQAFGSLSQSITDDTVRLGMTTTSLQDSVRQVRMVPFQSLALGLERAVRDAAHTQAKQVAFHIDGGDTELDKKVLETLKDPLMHLLRNAVDHGIESPEKRQAAGKSVEGQVTLSIQQRGSEVRITVRDDGRGFDLDGLRQASGASDENGSFDDPINLAFLPGVTTAQEVTALSGRGVGLDVVRKQLETIHGRISVDNTPGQGVSIELIVPTSMAITRGLMVRVGDEHYALPLLSIEKIVEPTEVFLVGGKSMLTIDDTPLPLVHLGSVLERSAPDDEPVANPLAIIMGIAEQRLALLVDDVLTEQELAVKPLGNPLKQVRNVTGAALQGNGQPIIVLNPADLVKSLHRATTLVTPVIAQNGQQTELRVRILVVDDSITTRTLEKNILEAAGFDVTTATDGIEALRRLDETPIDLVVSDIQMPNMDGFALTRHLRESGTYQELPIILVTSLESREDREQGMRAGADAYIVKRGFDQAELLTTIQQHL